MKIKNQFFLLVALLGFTVTISTAQASQLNNGGKAARTLKADPQQTTLTWTGKKIGGEHAGNISLANGSLLVENNKLVGGSFTIDMTSLTNTDLTDADYNAKLVGHLKSDDFFGVEKYPEAQFKITKASPIRGAKAGENNYNISGYLTIKGITKAVTFPALVKIEGDRAEATAKITVDRSQYNVRYGSPSFFADLGDKAIDNDFIIDLKLVAAGTDTAAAGK